MFTSLKNKIREETGNDVCAAHPAFLSHRRNSLILNNFNNNNITDPNQNGTNNVTQQRISTIISPIDQLNAIISQKNEEINMLIESLNESEAKFTKIFAEHEELMNVKDQLEKSNNILEDTLKVAHKEKELINNEHDKIQNLQAQEISKLKNLLHFREQVNKTLHNISIIYIIYLLTISLIYRRKP